MKQPEFLAGMKPVLLQGAMELETAVLRQGLTGVREVHKEILAFGREPWVPCLLLFPGRELVRRRQERQQPWAALSFSRPGAEPGDGGGAVNFTL